MLKINVQCDGLMEPNTSLSTRKQQYAHHMTDALCVRTIVLLGSIAYLELYEAC